MNSANWKSELGELVHGLMRNGIRYALALLATVVFSVAANAKLYPSEDYMKLPQGEDLLAFRSANKAIEPELTEEDRELYATIEPHIHDNPNLAIDTLEGFITPESNEGFDFMLGSLYYSIGDFEQAITWLNRTIAKRPSFRRAHRILGLCLVQQGQASESITHWLSVVKLGGGDAQSYGLLGYAYLAESKYSSALQAYQRARMYDADSFDFKRGEARCLLETGQTELAIALFDELIASDPNEVDFWLLQTNAFLSQRDRDDAIGNLELVKEMGWDNWETNSLLADLYLDREAYSLSVENYVLALESELEIGAEKARKPLERLVRMRRFDEAQRYLTAYEARFAESKGDSLDAAATVLKSRLQVETGFTSEAIANLETLVQDDPLAGEALILLGSILRREDRVEEALYYLERASSIEEVKAEALVNMGRIEVGRKHYQAAIELLRDSLKIEPRENVREYLDRVIDIAGKDAPGHRGRPFGKGRPD